MFKTHRFCGLLKWSYHAQITWPVFSIFTIDSRHIKTNFKRNLYHNQNGKLVKRAKTHNIRIRNERKNEGEQNIPIYKKMKIKLKQKKNKNKTKENEI